MTGIGLRAIVGPPFMRSRNRCPADAAGVAGFVGTGKIADMAVMGEGSRD
jgi:hypothetical protein